MVCAYLSVDACLNIVLLTDVIYPTYRWYDYSSGIFEKIKLHIECPTVYIARLITMISGMCSNHSAAMFNMVYHYHNLIRELSTIMAEKGGGRLKCSVMVKMFMPPSNALKLFTDPSGRYTPLPHLMGHCTVLLGCTMDTACSMILCQLKLAWGPPKRFHLRAVKYDFL